MSKDSDALRTAWEVVCSDEALVEQVVGIISDVKDGEFSNKEPLSNFYTVGDVRKIPGFYASDFIIQDMIGVYMGRLSRMICLGGGLALADPDIMKFILETEEQQNRCIPLVKQALTQKYGEPSFIAIDRVKKLRKRMLEGFREMGMPVSDGDDA